MPRLRRRWPAGCTGLSWRAPRRRPSWASGEWAWPGRPCCCCMHTCMPPWAACAMTATQTCLLDEGPAVQSLALPPSLPCRSRVAMELKGVVEAQQAVMQQAAGPAGAAGAPAGAAAASPAASARPHIAQLQRLVRDMRAELRQPPAVPAAPAPSAEPSPQWQAAGWGEAQPDRQQQAEQQRQAAALAEELASTKARLRQMQEAHDALLAQQVGVCLGLPGRAAGRASGMQWFMFKAILFCQQLCHTLCCCVMRCRRRARTAVWRLGRCKCSWSMPAGGRAVCSAAGASTVCV